MSNQAHLNPEHAMLNQRLDEILEELKKINGAFPRDEEGRVDHEGHRKYHESLIKAAEAQEKFWQELRLDVAKKGVWGVLIIVLGLIMVGLMTKLGLEAPGLK